MTLTEEARERLADLVELQPTKNSELQDRWELESGSEVHQYLENELKEYYYRDENSYICATTEANDLVDVEPGMVADEDGDTPSVVRVPKLQQQTFSVLAGPDDRSESVVSVLHKLREEFDIDPDADEVRSALQSLKRKGVVEVVYRTVPTFKLAVAREDITVEASG
ncbi:DUF5797 family protein [Haladaptatus pallidirubidus]|uniref:DUF5797 family protein n=1 Tax=Haladaptatus pallidirubidus TaxID=1008152 RepID=A0AAV3ULI0_9EURY|nr:DUF5797 family protein [Haladaptatus pallidirubidus]